jgi:hypothetical protein
MVSLSLRDIANKQRLYGECTGVPCRPFSWVDTDRLFFMLAREPHLAPL